MEEKIESLLKEKEKSTQVAIARITTIPITVTGTIGESTLATTKSTSTIGDINKVI